jgi:hypothetical protein
MGRVEKTVFLSYRRTNIAWALAIFQDLTQHGYDLFFDFKGIASGDFERVIMANIEARAHFIVLLTPTALERCDDPNDWLRREIEIALSIQRNIVPIALEGFDFNAPQVRAQLTGALSALNRYNALPAPAEYFDEAMQRLREKYLNVALDGVLHPAPPAAREAAERQKAAAAAVVQQIERDVPGSFERGLFSTDLDDKVHLYSQAVIGKTNELSNANRPNQAREKTSSQKFDLWELDQLEEELRNYFGPLAKVLVSRAAKQCTSRKQLYELLAQELPPAQRARFLAKRPV